MRRSLDIGVALFGGLVALPVAALVALAVALTIGRPVLFRQQRAGRGGTPFTLVKFRTMTEARDAQGRLLDDAARTPPFGRWLRRSRLDELPELLNIARGDMSLVGPRPLLPATVAAMGSRGARRGAMRPGLTGWAQVNGNTLLADDDKLALDLWYIDHASLRLDLAIVLRTIGVVLLGERIDQTALGRAERGRAYAGDHRRGG